MALPGASGAANDPARIQVSLKRHIRVGQSAVVRGRIDPQGVREVVVRASGEEPQTIQTRPDGTFEAVWQPAAPGTYRVQVEAPASGSSQPGTLWQRGAVNVYRPVSASYYGPGLYGNGTACGGRLTPSTQGVANKSLPCGTKVTLRHGKRTVTVPVIDRGPYAGDREYDLTAATKQRLGFGSTGTVLTTK